MVAAGILYHQEPECSFPDGGYRESNALMSREGSECQPLQAVRHESFKEAARFQCSWCYGEFWAGTLQSHELSRRKEVAKQQSKASTRQRLIFAAIFTALIFALGLILNASGAYYVVIGIMTVMAFLSVLLPENAHVPETAVMNAKTGTFSDDRHFLKLADC